MVVLLLIRASLYDEEGECVSMFLSWETHIHTLRGLYCLCGMACYSWGEDISLGGLRDIVIWGGLL